MCLLVGRLTRISVMVSHVEAVQATFYAAAHCQLVVLYRRIHKFSQGVHSG